ncbi:MAG TPA: hypothetical protein VMX96_03095 [Dehalococcoidia bacterium]|nr:hypothetical protein [Dehalococcoidia bacterium]
MDREQKIKELTDVSAVRRMVFERVKDLVGDYQAKKESSQIEEFAEFVLLRDSIKKTFAPQNLFEQQLVEFVLAFAAAFCDAITENNRRWLQVLSEEET